MQMHTMQRGARKTDDRLLTRAATARLVVLCVIVGVCLTFVGIYRSSSSAVNGAYVHATDWRSALESDKEYGSLFDGAIKDVVLKEEGKWEVWDGKSIIASTVATQECTWTDYRAEVNNVKSKVSMCVHGDDKVSANIRRVGKWADCDPLTQLWGDNGDRIYLELGANIGACMMQMLLTTQARIVAFEPNPQNLFCLTSTLMRMEPALSSRVVLFPIGGGDANLGSEISSDASNLGNSVIGVKASTTNPGASAAIHVRRLDDVFAPTLTAPLMKMDVEGYECKAAAGMPKLLTRVQTLKTEVNQNALRSQKCSGEGLLKLLEKSGYSAPLDEAGQPLTKADRNRPLMDIIVKHV